MTSASEIRLQHWTYSLGCPLKSSVCTARLPHTGMKHVVTRMWRDMFPLSRHYLQPLLRESSTVASWYHTRHFDQIQVRVFLLPRDSPVLLVRLVQEHHDRLLMFRHCGGAEKEGSQSQLVCSLRFTALATLRISKSKGLRV